MALDPDLVAVLDRLTKSYADELIALRRDVHAHPERGREEVRTTGLVRDRLVEAGLEPVVLPGGTGVVCDILDGSAQAEAPLMALRADLDALPVPDEKRVPYRSTVPGLCHACGHDVHTAALLGAGLVLRDMAEAGELTRPVRLIFQPAEELTPGGALDVISAGGLTNVDQIVAVHCDPRLPVGRVGLKAGPITAAADQLTVRLSGKGGHTARPHLTADLVHALGTLVTQLPTALSRRVDPRSGLSVVWGHISAGSAPNAIPQRGEAAGTLRCLDLAVWEACTEVVPMLARSIVAPYGVDIDVDLHRGVPPVDNDEEVVTLLADVVEAVLGPEAVVETDQSLGGEDFAWYLTRVPGALARLGVAPPRAADVGDLHRGTFDVDERVIGIGTRLLVATALCEAPPGRQPVGD